jgi:Flp pilus assembly protein TadD
METRNRQLQQLFAEGTQLLQAGNPAEALVRFQEALVVDPSSAILLLHAGTALHDLKRYDEAVSRYQEAVQINPDMGEVHNNLGTSLMALGRFAEAASCFSLSALLLPENPVPLTARATALQALGMVAEAEADCRRAIKLDPSFAAAHWNLALNLLLQGQYMEGWQEYEWRWRKPDFTSPARHEDVPLWDGSPLNGRTILLHAEQGFGDAIQFVRYASLVVRQGGDVILECHPQLVSLFQTLEGVRAVIPFGHALPHISCQAPLLSLPRIFGTTLQNIPSACPYVSAAAEQRRKWSELISGDQAGLKVGLVWAGKCYPDPLRSCRLEDFTLLGSDGVTFYSLQLGDERSQLAAPPANMHVVDLTHRIQDFSDTAALIEQLDLVISIDTAVAHLAGALGKPVWVMLPWAPDWRWLRERADSPWYPSMRVFRQKESGEWGGVTNLISEKFSVLYSRKNKAP